MGEIIEIEKTDHLPTRMTPLTDLVPIHNSYSNHKSITRKHIYGSTNQ